MTEAEIISTETLADDLDSLVSPILYAIPKIDVVAESAPAAEFGAITAFNDILQNVALSLRAVAGTLRDGGLNVEDTQAGMRKSRESMEQFINSIAGAGTE